MAEKKIDVTTTWGSTDTDICIKISADTLRAAGEALSKLEEWGKFEGDIGYTYETEGAYVTSVSLTPSYIIKMPEWDGYNSAPKACQQEWDRMWKCLEEHEDGHRQIHQEVLDKIEKYLDKATKLSEKKLKSEFAKMMKAGQASQDKFDKSTGHGKKKGVELNIPGECE